MTTNEYVSAYNNMAGSALERVRMILAQYAEDWGWEGHHSIVSDLLDDQTIQIADILAILDAAAKYECRTEAMANAVAALNQCVSGEAGSSVIDASDAFAHKREAGTTEKQKATASV